MLTEVDEFLWQALESSGMEGIGHCKREGRGWGLKTGRVCESLFKESISRFPCAGDGKGRKIKPSRLYTQGHQKRTEMEYQPENKTK